MLKRPPLTCFYKLSTYVPGILIRGYVKVCLVVTFILLPAVKLFPEGSKEINANGGNRAFLFSSNAASQSFPFPTLGTMKVYVNVGETINIGSSVQGIGSGTINLRAPDGSTYTSGNSATAGLIASHSQELAGPAPNAGGYTPYTKKVANGQQGVWEIDFISQSNGVDMGNPPPIPSSSDWAQPQGEYIAAFDISVRDAGNDKFLTGRVFTNVFSGILGTFNVGFNGIFNIITSDGYQYTLNNNGQAGNGFTFFVNNKGFRNNNGTASYKSVNNANNPNVQDPRLDDTPSDITQKIFFNTPASDLPATAKTPEGTTWLLKTPAVPALNNVGFTGIEGTAGKAGTNPLGSNFTFDATVAGTYSIAIDVNQNGIFTDAIDRKFTGDAVVGTNTIYWDGLDGLGKKVPADPQGNYKASIVLTTKAGEVHFPFFDVERNVNGILLTRTNGSYAPDDTVYWDDSPITIVGTPSNPIKNLTGISSLINGHKWGSPAFSPLDDADFGNNKSIDTWSYIITAPILSSVGFQLQEADLAVDSIQGAASCAGQEVVYTITASNAGPSDISGGKFMFSFPSQVTNVAVSSSSITGISSISNATTSSTQYVTDIALAGGASRAFTIKGTIAISAKNSFNVEAAILRPADVTDPDATDPDAAPPTDPVKECSAGALPAGCNNIKSFAIIFKPASNAGPDQTVLLNQIVNLSGTGNGTWSQAVGDPAMAAITNPADSVTSAMGLINTGMYHFIYTNPNACADTVVITVLSTDLIIPNVFTPNNDGKNDVFKISGLESFPGSQLIVINRWGNEVYKSEDYLNNWDGSGLAEGTYYYILNRRERNGGFTTFKGWVLLKRGK
jgi:gliding motility-associated-like protein/uncharacterized repeat protein (TIGR01451 family)